MKTAASDAVLGVLFPVLLLLTGCGEKPRASMVTWETGQYPDSVCSALLEPTGSPGSQSGIVYIEYSPVEGTDDWYIARLDTERGWWGGFRVFGWDGLTITDTASQAPGDTLEVTGQSVEEVGSLIVPGIEDPVVYVIDRTHQGNRMLYLWKLADDSYLYPLCKARITLNLDDSSYDLSWWFEDDGTGTGRLVLEGDLHEPGTAEDGAVCVIVPVRKVYTLDEGSGKYLLDYGESTGIRSWDFMDSGYADPQQEQDG